MPTSVTIRNVPERTRDELAARARRSGRSLQEYLLAELNALAARPDVTEVLGRAQDRLVQTRQGVDADEVVAMIREDRA